MVGLLRDGAIVALAANLANLFDRAPGRVTKVTTIRCSWSLVVATGSPTLAGSRRGGRGRRRRSACSSSDLARS